MQVANTDISNVEEFIKNNINSLNENHNRYKYYFALLYDYVVGQKEVQITDILKKELNLIRGILIDKDLYFFDEPTSNLDIESEEKIINMIEKYLNDKTYVIVTHRPRLKDLCNKHYNFENHIMNEVSMV